MKPDSPGADMPSETDSVVKRAEAGAGSLCDYRAHIEGRRLQCTFENCEGIENSMEGAKRALPIVVDLFDLDEKNEIDTIVVTLSSEEEGVQVIREFEFTK